MLPDVVVFSVSPTAFVSSASGVRQWEFASSASPAQQHEKARRNTSGSCSSFHPEIDKRGKKKKRPHRSRPSLRPLFLLASSRSFSNHPERIAWRPFLLSICMHWGQKTLVLFALLGPVWEHCRDYALTRRLVGVVFSISREADNRPNPILSASHCRSLHGGIQTPPVLLPSVPAFGSDSFRKELCSMVDSRGLVDSARKYVGDNAVCAMFSDADAIFRDSRVVSNFVQLERSGSRLPSYADS